MGIVAGLLQLDSRVWVCIAHLDRLMTHVSRF